MLIVINWNFLNKSDVRLADKILIYALCYWNFVVIIIFYFIASYNKSGELPNNNVRANL